MEDTPQFITVFEIYSLAYAFITATLFAKIALAFAFKANVGAGD